MAEEETFKVTDRRGRERDVAPTESAPGAAPASSARATTGEGSARHEHEQHVAPDLEGLFMMFASSAVISLSDAPDPATGQHRVDLDQARDAIDLLRLLRDKTEGNRTERESRLLDQILYDLQMRFVDASKRAPRA